MVYESDYDWYFGDAYTFDKEKESLKDNKEVLEL